MVLKKLSQEDFKIAKELKRRLAKIVELVDFRVFGSRATGKADEYSDMDVFIEVAALTPAQKEKIYDIVWEVGFDNFLLISPLVFTKEEIENSPLRASPIVKNVTKEGVKV